MARRFDKTVHKTAQNAKIKLFTLKKNEAIDFHLRVAVMPPEETGRMPPRFDSLVLDTMVGFKGKSVRFFGGKKKIKLELDELHQALSGQRYAASAFAEIEDDAAYLTMEGDKIYYWNISNQGTVYPPEETKNCGTAFTNYLRD